MNERRKLRIKEGKDFGGVNIDRDTEKKGKEEGGKEIHGERYTLPH